MVRIGDKIKIASDNENENYAEYRNKVLTVNHIAINRKQHPGYDEGIGGQLVSCKNFPFSIYEYEFEIIKPAVTIKDAKTCDKFNGIWVPKGKKCYI